jgi:hypothetical protein
LSLAAGRALNPRLLRKAHLAAGAKMWLSAAVRAAPAGTGATCGTGLRGRENDGIADAAPGARFGSCSYCEYE